jgi:hypothetical protein
MGKWLRKIKDTNYNLRKKEVMKLFIISAQTHELRK